MTAHSCEGPAEIDTPEPDGAPAARRLENSIPRRLLDRLVELRPYLLKQFSLRPRGKDANGSWQLRIRIDDPDVGRKRISVEIGDKKTGEAVKELVGLWREEAKPDETEEERRQESLRRYEKTVQEARAQILTAWGGGSSRRRRIRSEFDQAAADGPPTLLWYLWSGAYMLPSPRPGRRSKSGLC